MSEITGTGWLSPSGEFIQCESYAHIATAERIASQLKLNSTGVRIRDDDILINNGWIKIVFKRFMDFGYDISFSWHVPHSDIQINMIKSFAEREDITMVEDFNYNLAMLTDPERSSNYDDII